MGENGKIFVKTKMRKSDLIRDAIYEIESIIN